MKKLKRYIISLLLLVCFCINTYAGINDGLYAHFDFEGTSNDITSNLSGFEYGGGISYETGVVGKSSARFDGETAILFPNDYLFPLCNGTINLFVKIDPDVNSSSTLMDSKTNFRTAMGYNAVTQEFGYTKIPMNKNQWTMYTYVYSNGCRSNGSRKAYRNGVLINDSPGYSNNGNIGTWYSPSCSYYSLIGVGLVADTNLSTASKFKGLVDDIRIYNRPLSASEIQELYSLQNSLADSAILAIAPVSRNVAAGAGSTTFAVSNSGDGVMNWSAETDDAWLKIDGGASGTNSGTVTVGYTANNETTNLHGTARTGTITVNAPGVKNSPQVLLVTQSRETSLVGILHHFEFSAISSPQEINDAFAITVTAKDADNDTVSDFNDRVALFSSLGPVNPTALFFSSGTASANVALYDIGNTYLRCDGGGIQGQSNSFDVNGQSQCLSEVGGSLVDEKGDPVVGAKVQALVSAYADPTQEVVTDAQGNYIFNDLPCGKYWLRASATVVVSVDPVIKTKMVTKTIRSIKVDSQCLALPAFIFRINGDTYGTPVILVAGIMGSSSTTWDYKPGLSLEKPDRDLHIHLKDTGPGDKTGWESLDGYLSDDFLTFDCPWDWRLGADEAVREYLIPKINEALQRSTTGKVHIVAHSMGGLLARALIQSDIVYGLGEKYYQKIDKLVMIGTPHLGSCNPYYIWEGGDTLGLDNLVANGVLWKNFYTNTIERLWKKTYTDIKKKWSTEEHCSIVNFLVNDVSGGYDHHSSLRQLMYIGDFLTLKKYSDETYADLWKDVDSPGNENIWLKKLNVSSNVNRMSAKNEAGKIQALVLAGIGKETIDRIHVQFVPSSCPASRYEDGVPVADVSDRKNVSWTVGDGTVPYHSASWPAVQGWAKEGTENNDAAHFALPGQFNDQVYTFLAGVHKPRTANPLRTADPPTSTLTFTIDNGQRFVVVDPDGKQVGIDPMSGVAVNEITGAYMLFDGRQGVVSLPNPVVGSYDLAYYGGPRRDFELTVSYFADDKLDSREKSGFCPNTWGFAEVIFDPLADAPLTLNPPIDSCDCLTSQPYETAGQLYTRLQWDDNVDAVAYRVYTVADTEPYFHKLADIDKAASPEYDTGELWRDSADEPLRVYVVTFIDSNGNESFFSNKVYNDDRDHDNLTDLEEIALGTLIDNPDTDGDGLLDGDEVHAGSFPDDPDSDSDGYCDYGEVQGHADPRFADSIPDLHVNADGYCNGEYYCYPNIDEACQAAQGVGSIKIRQGIYPENLELSQGKLLTMAGGWNSDYSTLDDDSVVVGRLTISSGCLTVEKLVIGGQ